jgi:hypothetical protein
MQKDMGMTSLLSNMLMTSSWLQKPAPKQLFFLKAILNSFSLILWGAGLTITTLTSTLSTYLNRKWRCYLSVFGLMALTNYCNDAACPRSRWWCELTQAIYPGSGMQGPTFSRGVKDYITRTEVPIVEVTSWAGEGRTPSPWNWLRQVLIPNEGENEEVFACPIRVIDCPIYTPRGCMPSQLGTIVLLMKHPLCPVTGMALQCVVDLNPLVPCWEPRPRSRGRLHTWVP